MPHNRYLPTELSRDAAVRLVCLPYAGGGTAMYYRWRQMLDRLCDVVPICFPGRDARIHELPRTDLRIVASEIANELAPCGERPFALVGHSLGAIVAFELAHELRRCGRQLPCLLVAAASRAPHQSRSTQPLHHLSDAEFVAELGRRFDGIPPAVRESDELLRLVLPALRADVQMLETYEYHDEPPLDCEILAIGGTDDPAVLAADLAAWRRHSAGRFSTHLIPGGHFFLFKTGECEAVRMIAQKLERLLEG
jgi:surfactin synthase thioesterase subunit